MISTMTMKKSALIGTVALLALCPVLSEAAERSPGDATSSDMRLAPPAVASGAVEDTLKACLARIPKDASAGQRMMAEESCQRDEATRQPFVVAPGR